MNIKTHWILLFLICCVTTGQAQMGRYQLHRLPISTFNLLLDAKGESYSEDETMTILFDTQTGDIFEISMIRHRIKDISGKMPDHYSAAEMVGYYKTKLPFVDSLIQEETLLKIPPDYFEETQDP